MNYLNPQLYQALVRRFRHVAVENQGEPHVSDRRPSMHRPGRWEAATVRAGEYYVVSCPYCRDTRQRLYINHMFGVVDEQTKDDRLYLAHCFNEGCIDSRERQRDLYERIFPFAYGRRTRMSELPVSDATSDSGSLAPEVSLPCGLPLDDVQRAAPAREYLRGRGFDPDEIGQLWGVSYCPHSTTPPPAIRERIVIPMPAVRISPDGLAVESEVLAGWQARAIYPVVDDEPKYLSAKGMKKSLMLYGLPQARRGNGPIVVVEGPADVWRLGSNAVATLGNSISLAQQNLLIRHFAFRPIVILFDADSQHVGQAFAFVLRSARRKWHRSADVVAGALPVGRKDVGECSRDEAWLAVDRALHERTALA